MVTLHTVDVQRAAARTVHQNADTGQLTGGLSVVVPGNVEGGIAVQHGAGDLVIVAHIERRIDGQRR